MGGRITRALYKNERQASGRGNSRYGSQIRQLSVSFTLIMSSIASFLIGYLHRPYSLRSIANSQAVNITGSQTVNPYNNQQPLPQTRPQTDWQTLTLSLITLVIVVFGYVLKKQHPNQSSLQHILRTTKISATISGLLFIFEILSWLMSYQLRWIFTTAYGLLWISFANTCLLVFNNLKFLTHRKECKYTHNHNLQQINTPNLDFLNANRTVFFIFLLLLFDCGTKTSEYMRQLRVHQMINQVINAQQLSINQQSQTTHTLSSLPLQYQTFILNSQHYEKFMIRVVFLFLVLMIGTTIVAFQKKSLYHFYVFQFKKNDYIIWYQREIQASDQREIQRQPQNKIQRSDLKQYKKNNEQRKKNVFQNLSGRSIIMSSLLFMVGLMQVESQVQRIRYNQKEWQNQKELQNSKKWQNYQNQVSLKSGVLFIVITLGLSLLVVKGMVWVKFHLRDRLRQVNLTEQRQRKTKAIQIGLLWVVLIIILVFSAVIGNLLEINSHNIQSTQQNQSLKQIATYYFPLSLLLISQAFLSFYYIRFTKEQLWRFPQTSLQPYIMLTIVATFVTKYLLTYQLLTIFTQTIIQYTIQPFITVVKTLLFFFLPSNSSKFLTNQSILSTLIFVFFINILFIAINRHTTLQSILDLNSQIPSSHTQKLTNQPSFYPKFYDQDTKCKLTTNIVLQQSFDQTQEASKLLN